MFISSGSLPAFSPSSADVINTFHFKCHLILCCLSYFCDVFPSLLFLFLDYLPAFSPPLAPGVCVCVWSAPVPRRHSHAWGSLSSPPASCDAPKCSTELSSPGSACLCPWLWTLFLHSSPLYLTHSVCDHFSSAFRISFNVCW